MSPVTFHSVAHLLDYFTTVGQTVGPRTGPNKRTHDQKEVFNLRQDLSTLGVERRLQFPLTVKSGESPDFLLSDASGNWGLEVTEATTLESQS